MFCKKCGKQIPDDVAFCPMCGVTLESSSSVNSNRSAVDNLKGILTKRNIIIGLAVIVVIFAFILIVSGGDSKDETKGSKYGKKQENIELDGYYTEKNDKRGELNYTLIVDGDSCHMYVTSKTFGGYNFRRDYGEGIVTKTDTGYEMDFSAGELREDSPISVTVLNDGSVIQISYNEGKRVFVLYKISQDEFLDIMNKNY